MKNNTMDFSLSKEIRKYPFLRITIPFLFGIVFCLYIETPQYISGLLFIISLLLFFIIKKRHNYSNQIILGIFVNIILFSFGLFITQNTIDNSKVLNLNKNSGLLIGEISQDTKFTEKNIVLNLDILAINHEDEWISTSGKVLLYLDRDSLAESLRIGDIIVFTPNLSEVQNKGNPEEFDYKKYLSYNLIYNSDYLSGDEWYLLESYNNIKIKYLLLRFRTKLINTLSNLGLTDDELAVTAALALGYKNNLSNEIRHNYSSSGAMHILAVSGLHVGIIYGIIVFLLSFIKSEKFKYIKIFIIILFIWFYAVLTGLSPSVTRAALMFTIAALGSLQKHKSGSINTIAISAFILLLLNPLNIVDIGFQLSYIAVLGIIIIQPRLYELFEVKNRFLKWTWSLATVSIAAQIATAPLCIYYFNQFSNYFLLTNFILIPVSTIAIWLCIIVFIFSGIDFLGLFFTKILAFVVKIMNISVEFIDSLPFSVSENIYINLPQVFILYILIITLFVFFFISKKYKHMAISVIMLILFTGISLYKSIETYNQKYFIVYNINNVTAINLIDGRDNILFANLDMIDNEKIEFTAKNNWLKKGLDEEKYIDLSYDKNTILSNIVKIDNKRIFYKNKFIGFEDYRIYVLDNDFSINTDNDIEKISVDFIVLSNNPSINLSDIEKLFEYKMIIIDSSNSNNSIKKWEEENINDNYTLYNIKSEGAFIYKI